MIDKSISSKWPLIVKGIVLLLLLNMSYSFADLLRADINKDGRVDSSDMTIMRKEIGRDNCFSSPCQADLSGDGKVNDDDVEILKDELESSKRSDGDVALSVDQPDMAPAGGEGVQPLPGEEPVVETFPVDTGEDEEAAEDVTLPTTRFTDKNDGTVIDNETGLMWTKKADLYGDTLLYHQAIDYVEEMNRGKYPNFGFTDWRLPTLVELRSLIDYTKFTKWGHVLPTGHPFEDIRSLNFTRKESYMYAVDQSWLVSLYCRLVGHNVDSCFGYVWAVRGAGD